MSLNNKSFRDNQTGKIVKVIDSYQNIAITNTNEKIDTRRLVDPKYYSEYIDPASFFDNQNTYSVFAEKIKGVDISKIPEDGPVGTTDVYEVKTVDSPYRPTTNESAVIISNPDDEIEEMKRKYGVVNVDVSAVNRQNEVFSKILGEEAPPQIQQPVVKKPQEDTYIEPNQTFQQTISDPIERIEVRDPIITMFRGVKRTVNFKFNLKIENKIPRLDFIEMMEDSYDTSIIDFLAEEFTREIINNPEKLKEKIVSEIKLLLPKKEETQPEIILEKPSETVKKITRRPKIDTANRVVATSNKKPRSKKSTELNDK